MRLFRFLPTTNFVRALLVPSLVFIAASMDRGYQTDFWEHMARGRVLVRQHALVDVDVFSCTVAGQVLRDPNWLTEIAYARLFQLGGLNLVQFVNALTLAVTFGLLVSLCRRESGSPAAALYAGTLAFLASWQTFLIRPQTFSLLLFVLTYGALLSAKRVRAMLLLPPLLMAVWVNVHGGFLIGLLLVGSLVLKETIEALRGANGPASHGRMITARLAPWWGCLAFTGLATLLTPYGWRIYQYVAGLTSVAAGRHVQEWLPPGLDTWIGRMGLFSLVLFGGLLALARRRPTVKEVCLALVFLPLAGRSVRMVVWWVMVAAPLIACLLAATVLRPQVRDEARPSLAAGVFAAVLLGLSLLSVPWLEAQNPLFGTVRTLHRTESDVQVAADQIRARHDRGRIFARLEWGEYLDWALPPANRVFMDGRIEIFPDSVWRDYCAVSSGQADWAQILGRYRIDYLLLDATYHSNLLRQVNVSQEWEPQCEAGPAVLFVRRGVVSSSPDFEPDLSSGR